MINRRKSFDILRVAFGLVWGIDAYLKWNPAFLNGLGDMLSSMVRGQPGIVAGWIGLWVRIVGVSPHLFAVGIALLESALAIALVLDVFPRAAYVGGFFFSLLVWSIGEGFGGPYVSGSTDIGAAVIYAFVFAALYFDRFGGGENQIGNKSLQSSDGKKGKSRQTLSIQILSVTVIVLLALLAAPYFVSRTSTAQQTDMPPGMTMKTFYIGPLRAVATSTDMADMNMMSGMNTNTATTTVVPAGILASTTAPDPTIHFTIVKDTLDGWDLHITTTNFTWTPQNINQAPVADQGHAHLYIDGNLTVLFGPWYHIDGSVLPPGRHTITVSLNANDHSVFSVDGENVQETQTLIVSPI